MFCPSEEALMTPEQIIAVVTALLAGEPDPAAFPVITAGGADPRYPLVVGSCPEASVPPTEVEGSTVICGQVNVPEDHAKPDGKRIDLAFAVLKARTQSPVPDPVIYLHGGPGGGAVQALAGIVHPLFDGYRDRRDVVTFDQRAAGISSDMVTCFRTLGGNIYELLEPSAATEEMQGAFFKDCVAELVGTGSDLTAYNTYQNALDVQALMLALGYQDYNIYGVSYGTTLGLEVMRSAPEKVRSVVLDSVSPPQAKVYDENAKPTQESIQAVLDQCAADPACAAAFPDLEAVLMRVAEQLQKAPIPAARGKPEVTITSLIDLFSDRNQYGALPNATRYIPLILTEWDRGETTTWDLLKSGATNAPPSTAERVSPFADKLTPDQKTLAALLFDMADNEAKEDRSQYASVQALALSLRTKATGATDLKDRLGTMITASIAGTRSKEEALGLLRAVGALVAVTPSKDALRTLVNTHLPPADLPDILAVIDLMTDADVAAFFADFSGTARASFAPMVGAIDLFLVACQESIPFNSREGFQAYSAALKFEFLNLDTQAQAQMYDICELFTPVPRAGFHEAVTSDIPALVLYGLNDTQTSSADAKDTAEKLGNARVLGFPEAGHGALIFSKCARDIGLAFIELPEADLATGCIDGLKPKWVLPNG
jgi:pimeloyl-ACP methyl ester carboxylesterase